MVDRASDAAMWGAAETIVRAFCDGQPWTDEAALEPSCNWPACPCEMRPREALVRACAELQTEVADLKISVAAFAGPWAAQFARMHGLPEGHLHPTHYDILARAGARMVDFTRAEIEPMPELDVKLADEQPPFPSLASTLIERSIQAFVAKEEELVRRMLAVWEPAWGEPALALRSRSLRSLVPGQHTTRLESEIIGLVSKDTPIGKPVVIHVSAADHLEGL